MKVLVTGGAGFIGGHLVRELSRRHEVLATTRTEAPADTPAEVEWLAIDLASPDFVDGLPASGIDAVVHLAQSRRYRDFPDGAPDMVAVNVRATFALAEWARAIGASRFVYASTGGVYRRKDGAITEEDPIDPSSFYFQSKYAAEVLLRGYSDLIGVSIVRPFFVYGPGQQPGMLVPGLAKRVLAGEAVVVEGKTGIRVNPIYVLDVVKALDTLLAERDAGTMVVNLAGDEVVSISELVGVLAAATGQEATIRSSEERAKGDLVADNGRMKSKLGLVPAVSLGEGLREVAELVRRAG